MFAASSLIILGLLLLLCTVFCSTQIRDSSDQWLKAKRSIQSRNASEFNIPEVELQSLSDLYYGTGGEKWNWNSIQPGIPWNFSGSPNPCADHWQGIACSVNTSDSDYIHVVTIMLPIHNLHGELPDSIGNFSQLINMDISANGVNGTIPETIGNLKHLQFFNASENKWTGTIPESIGNLLDLRMFDVSGVVLDYYVLKDLIRTDPEHLGEGLSGSIPDSFANLTELRYFSVGYNAISGSPEPLGHLHKLEYMFLYLNRFTGSFPDSFNALRNLQQFSVGSNNITGTNVFDILRNNVNLTRFVIGINDFQGTIPAVLGERLQLVDLDLSYNHFYGPLPLGVQNLTHLELFNLANNSFTGTIPVYLDAMPNLTYLDFGQNHFNSTLPDCIGNLHHLQFLDLGQNALTGTIADRIGNLSSMLHFNLGNNLFRGKLPASLGNYHQTYLFDLDNNQFSGSIPESFSMLKSVQFLNLSDNQLTGTIPAGLTKLAHLTTLDLSDNRLTGSIPELMHGNHSKLQVLYLQNNRLHGHIPASLSNASLLETLLLQNNRLSGPLTNVFNASTQRSLSLIQLSQNQLTGTFPDDIFFLSSLKTLVAVENCFSGALPECVCDCTTLRTLALDGLQSASSCQNKLFHRLSNAYVTYRTIQNGIPKCLYELPMLYALHLSGNGLTGSLPDDVTVSSCLRSLSLSNNVLTGSIPLQFQEHTWDLLDLSFNHISGVLHGSFAPLPANGSLSLETNRLSGKLPRAVIEAQDVSVLNGNLFSCGLDKKHLPAHDVDRSDYVCGSNAFDTPYYLWLATVSVILVVAFVLWRRWDYFDRRFQIAATANKLRGYYDFPLTLNKDAQHARGSEASSQSSVSSKTNHAAGRSLEDRLRSVRYICEIMDILCRNTVYCAVFITAVLLLYFPISSPFYSTHEYPYAYTASAAYTSGKVPFAVEMVLFIVVQVVVMVVFRTTLYSYEAHLSRKDRNNEMIVRPREPYLSVTSLQKFPIYGAYFAINFTVVLGVNVAFVYVTLYQSYTVLVICQILMSMFKLMWNYFLSYFAIVFFAEKDLTGAERQNNVSRVFYMQLFVLLMNNIAIPCFVVAAISPGCFYNVFVQAPASTSSYVYQQCTGIILETGCNIYVDTLASVSYRPPYSYSYQCSSSIVKNYAPAFVYMCLAATFAVPAAQCVAMWLHARQKPGSRLYRLLNIVAQYPVLHEASDQQKQSGDESGERTANSVILEPQTRYRMYFNANQVLLSQLTFLGMLMTFGVVFPPLAAAFAFTICVTSVFARLKVGYFLRRCLELNQLAYLDKINIECTRVVSVGMLRNAVWMLVIFSCCFYTLFLFDTLGDVVGFHDSYWVLIVMPLLPVFFFGVSHVVPWLRRADGVVTPPPQSSSGCDLHSLDETSNGVVLSPLSSHQSENKSDPLADCEL